MQVEDNWPSLACGDSLEDLPLPPVLTRQDGQLSFDNLSTPRLVLPPIETLRAQALEIDWSLEAAPPSSPQPSPKKLQSPPQSLDARFMALLHPNIDKKKVISSFEGLSKALLKSPLGDCRAYHSILNEWLSARLSRVAAAQMIVRYFAHDRQVCYIFKEISDNSLLNRHVRSCIRNFARKQ